MKKIFNFIKTVIKFTWFPILLLLIFLFLAYRIAGSWNWNSETTKIALGVMLGVALGFVADFLQKRLDEYQKVADLKRTALSLLKNDAEKIYSSMELLKSARENKDKAPKELQEVIEKGLPPSFELRYWKRLNQNNDFLLLGSEEPFKSIFNDLWDLEKINDQIEMAQKQDKQAYMFAMAMYNHSLEVRHHEKLLSRFMGIKDLEDFKQNLEDLKSRKTQ